MAKVGAQRNPGVCNVARRILRGFLRFAQSSPGHPITQSTNTDLPLVRTTFDTLTAFFRDSPFKVSQFDQRRGRVLHHGIQ